ncbi:type IX secretion system membrane protein PorP/SprF [Fulvivirga maritima]|nr:type IX secretion system membrane protein PorP/SprF [Fulvivirga maritima]UII27405.1 type IX secretion system membrane protein PorP/SprF [Fulvivirga maritima]
MFLLGTKQVEAQRSPTYTQYMFNGLVVNPAYTGSQKAMAFTAAYRSQWTGIKGAPETQLFSMHTPVKFSRSSVGGMLVHDQAGVLSQTTLNGTYSYYIPVSAHGRIAMGGQLGLSYYRANLADLDIVTQGNTVDPTFMANEGDLMPNLGLGVYYYSKTTYVGIAMPTVVNNKWKSNDQEIEAEHRHYFLTAGHVFDLNHDLKLKPNVLLRWVEGGPIHYDINVNVFFRDLGSVGVSYSLDNAVSGLLEVNITNQLAFGYSYGYSINTFNRWGTHEFVLNYRISKDAHIIRSPRYF